jgi:hypothetical protein
MFNAGVFFKKLHGGLQPENIAESEEISLRF